MNRDLTITGELTKVRFKNDDNHYTVAEFLAADTGIRLTVVGYLAGIREGETLKVRGVWEKHNRFGQQFKVDSYEPVLPTTIEEIKKYLKVLDISGMSPKKIKALMKAFGEKTLDIIENQPESLESVKGIGKTLAERITRAWEKHNEIRSLISFLQEYEIPLSFSALIYRTFESDAVNVITRDPYRLALDCPDISFSIVDRTARMLGIEKNDPSRVSACLMNLLDQFASDGHVYTGKDQLTDRCSVLYGIEQHLVETSLEALADERKIVMETRESDNGEIAVYNHHLYKAETGISNTLNALVSMPVDTVDINADDIIEEVLKTLAIKLSEEQLEALEDILSHKIAVITGGPGTGKTTLIRSVTAICKRLGRKTLLAAPTGRAARRLSEVTGNNAATIHKMLMYNFRENRFEKNRDDTLDADTIIVDEASMIDISLMYHLLNAIPFTATVVFVGDIFQLPSVGPGTVLSDLITCGRFRTFELTRIFRQAQESAIILNSHRVRYGKPPKLNEPDDPEQLSEFYFIETSDPVTVMERVVELCCNRIPDRYCFDPMTDIQVLTPMHKGDVGTISLNNALQKVLNRETMQIDSFGKTFKVNDKVMHLKNNYEKDVFNGDIGTIESIDSDEKILNVNYYGRSVEYDFDDLNELTLAYAISVHKSQGSEYPAVVVPVTTQHYALLQRNLLYTAMTRGKQLVVLIGTRKALDIALANDRPTQRLSGLADRLKTG